MNHLEINKPNKKLVRDLAKVSGSSPDYMRRHLIPELFEAILK